jgi:hypothetical protein
MKPYRIRWIIKGEAVVYANSSDEAQDIFDDTDKAKLLLMTGNNGRINSVRWRLDQVYGPELPPNYR